MIKVAINGFGRIGRMVFRAGYKDKKIKFVAVNDLTDNKTLAHLLKYDSVHGTLQENVGYTDGTIVVGKKKIKTFAEKDPSKLPWRKLGVDIVIESTGFFRKPDDAKMHLDAGARKVIISATCKCENNVCPVDTTTIVMGVNENNYHRGRHDIISNASCTTNCVAPILKIVHNSVGIKRCFFTTIHAYTATQKIVDGPHKDLRRARAAAINLVPTSTGADTATVQVIPALKGKIRGMAFRTPLPNGSVTDFTIETTKDITSEQINKLFKKMARRKYRNVLEYSERELVSTDIIGNPYSAIYDSKLTKVVDKRILKIVAWYDNEWGYSCRVVDLIKLVVK